MKSKITDELFEGFRIRMHLGFLAFAALTTHSSRKE